MPYLWVILIAFIFSKLGTYITIQLANQNQLFETNDHRKLHTEKVAALGGIPVFVSVLVISLIAIIQFNNLFPIFLGTVLLFGVGLWDDLKDIGVKRRLITQIGVASLAFFAEFNFGFNGSLAYTFANYCLTVGFIVLMINGVNFMDGINGLAGSIGVLAFTIFSGIFFDLGQTNLAILAAAYAGALIGFLSYNYGEKAKIFMGDNGSTVMGFMLAIFTLSIGSASNYGATDFNSFGTTLCMIALPLLDLVAVVFIRIIKGGSPLKADRIHLHHLLTDGGKSHPAACQFILVWLLSLIGIFHFQLIDSLILSLILIIGSYMAIRMKFTIKTIPAISPVEWDTPVQKPSPIG